ncbi:hypothetical protein ACTMUQ_03755 [Streptomyces sp. SD11]
MPWPESPHRGLWHAATIFARAPW